MGRGDRTRENARKLRGATGRGCCVWGKPSDLLTNLWPIRNAGMSSVRKNKGKSEEFLKKVRVPSEGKWSTKKEGYAKKTPVH